MGCQEVSNQGDSNFVSTRWRVPANDQHRAARIYLDTDSHKCTSRHTVKARPHPYIARDKQQPISATMQITCAVATALPLVRSTMRTGLPPPDSSINKENLVFVYPMQVAPMLRQEVRLHITDHLRATVPNLKQANVAGSLHEAVCPCTGQILWESA